MQHIFSVNGVAYLYLLGVWHSVVGNMAVYLPTYCNSVYIAVGIIMMLDVAGVISGNGRIGVVVRTVKPLLSGRLGIRGCLLLRFVCGCICCIAHNFCNISIK